MRIFLDDERFPILKDVLGYEPELSVWQEHSLNGEKVLLYPYSDIIICRTVPSAMAVLKEYKQDIQAIMFDNDLGEELEGKDFAKMIVEWDMDENEAGRSGLNPNIKFSVHSQNVPAAKYIHDYLNAYLKQK